MVRVNELPKVEAYIVSSTKSPSGLGEPTVPPIGQGSFERGLCSRWKRRPQIAAEHKELDLRRIWSYAGREY
jgi:hypothetical protein